MHKHFNRRSQLLLKSEFQSHLNEFERTPSPIPRVLYTKKSDWNSWNFYVFNKHLSSNQILCFFVEILTTINCCRNQPHKRLNEQYLFSSKSWHKQRWRQYLTDMAKFILHLLHHPLVICSAAMQCRANVNHSWSGMQHWLQISFDLQLPHCRASGVLF